MRNKRIMDLDTKRTSMPGINTDSCDDSTSMISPTRQQFQKYGNRYYVHLISQMSNSQTKSRSPVGLPISEEFFNKNLQLKLADESSKIKDRYRLTSREHK